MWCCFVLKTHYFKGALTSLLSTKWQCSLMLVHFRTLWKFPTASVQSEDTQPSFENPPSFERISMETFRRWLNNVIMLSIHEDTWFKRWFNYEAEGEKFFVCSFSSNFPTAPSLRQGTFFLLRAVLSFHCRSWWKLEEPKQKRTGWRVHCEPLNCGLMSVN